MTGTRLCTGSLVLLIALKLAWHGLYHPPATGFSGGLAMTLLPLLPLAAALAFSLRGPWIYAGIGVWVYFCHGAMEAYANPLERPWALAEIGLAIGYFIGLWLRTRAAKKAQAPG